jgi:hypothetical protein
LDGQGAPFVEELAQRIPLYVATTIAELIADTVEILSEKTQIVHRGRVGDERVESNIGVRGRSMNGTLEPVDSLGKEERG